MKKKLFFYHLLLTVTAVLLNSVANAQTTCNFPYSEPIEGEVAVVGQAVDSDRERFKVLNAFKGRETTVGGGLASLNASLVRHYDKIYQETYLKEGGKFSIGPFSFGKSREFTTIVTQKNYTATFMMTFEVNLPNGKWEIDSGSGSPLTDHAKTLVSDPCKFKQVFGDSFIFQTQRGARVYVAVNVAFSSQKNYNEFKKSMDASLEYEFSGFTKALCIGGVAKAFSIPAFNLKASFETAQSNISESVRRDGKVEVIAMQIGGDVSRLGQLFGTGGDVPIASCSLANLADCDAAFSKILAYIGTEEFADGVRTYPETLSYLKRSYWEVDPSITLIPEVTPEITAARNQLAENLLERTRDLNTINESLATSLSDGHRQQLGNLKVVLEEDIDDLTTAGFTCFSNLEECVQTAEQTLADLKAYSRDMVNINLSDGLVAYYSFNGNAHDETNNGNNVIFKGGPTLTSDRFGNSDSAYSFDGVDDWMLGSSNVELAKPEQTVAAWVKSQKAGAQFIAGYHTESVPYNGYGLMEYTSGRFSFLQSNYLSWDYAMSSELYADDGKWRFIAGTRKDGLSSIYIDGILQPKTSMFTPSFTNAKLQIGWYGIDPKQHFGGVLDDIFFYNRALSSTEIQQLYTATDSTNNQPPLAVFTSSAVTGIAPLTVSLDASGSSDADGSVISYEWQSSFGHRTSGTTPNMTFTDAGEYSIILNVTDDNGATSQAIKNITVSGSTDTSGPVSRKLGCYIAGTKQTVSLTATPAASTSNYAVEDTPPSGWTISNISHSGTYDPLNNRVKYGPFFDNTARTLAYDITPPAGTTGDRTFTGTASADGVNSSITGDSVISVCSDTHPADTDNNFAISIIELTAYGSAWKKGTAWIVPPNPVPIGYVTRAGALWKNGEIYKIDPGILKAPEWWVSDTTKRSKRSDTRDSGSSAIREISSDIFLAGQEITITINVKPASTVQAYALEESIPQGWTVSASDPGTFDTVNNKVKFGPFMDNEERLLTYRITPAADDSGEFYFSGIVSFDGSDLEISGNNMITIAGVDINDDGKTDLADVILALKIAAGLDESGINLNADIDGDGKIGITEAIFILQKLSM